MEAGKRLVEAPIGVYRRWQRVGLRGGVVIGLNRLARRVVILKDGGAQS